MAFISNVQGNSPELLSFFNGLFVHRLGMLERAILEMKNVWDKEKVIKELKEIIDTEPTRAQHSSEQKEALKKVLEKLEAFIFENSDPKSYESFIGFLILRDQKLALKIVPLGLSTIGKNTLRGSPLHIACKMGDAELIACLLAQRVDVNATYKAMFPANSDITPLTEFLSFATQGQCMSEVDKNTIFDMLLDAGADPKIGYFAGLPVISACIVKGFTEWARKILDKSDPEAQGLLDWWRPLHFAVAYRAIDIVKALLGKSVDTNAYCRKNIYTLRLVTPAHIAVGVDDSDTLKLLILAGANPHLRAINQVYQTNSCVKEWAQAEPLSAYMFAVDKHLTKCIDVIVSHAPPTKREDFEFEGKRDLTTASPHITLQRGYLSLNSRLKTEAAIRKNKLKSHEDIRCFSTNSALLPSLESFIDKYLQKGEFGGAQFLCGPIQKIIVDHFKSNPDFVIIFMHYTDIADHLNDFEITGDYNGDTQNEITVKVELTDIAKMASTFIHELTHKVADLVYPRKKCAPPSNSSFHEAYVKDLEHLKTCQSLHVTYIQELFGKVEKLYPEPLRPAEYLARIPQIALYLALKYHLPEREIEKTLQECIPNLFKFYQNEFLTALRAR